MRQQRGKDAPDSCGRQFFQGDGQLPGKANLVNERLRQPQLEVGQDEEPRPAVRRSGSAQFGEGPFQGLFEEAKQMRGGKASDVHPPDRFQVRGHRTRPPEPERNWLLGRSWQMGHFQANERSRDNGLGLAGSPLDMVLGNRMQPAPCLDVDLPVLRFTRGPAVGGVRPGGRIVAHELRAMSSWPSSGWHRRRDSIKAAARP